MLIFSCFPSGVYLEAQSLKTTSGSQGNVLVGIFSHHEEEYSLIKRSFGAQRPSAHKKAHVKPLSPSFSMK